MDLPYPDEFGAKTTGGGDVVLTFSSRGFGSATVILVADDADSLAAEIMKSVRKSDRLLAEED